MNTKTPPGFPGQGAEFIKALDKTGMSKRERVESQLNIWDHAARLQMYKARSDQNETDYAFFNGYLMGLNDARAIFKRVK